MTSAAHAISFEAAASPSCPVCREATDAVFLTRNEIAAELAARDQFFAARLDRTVARTPLATDHWPLTTGLRDLTDVVLGTPAAIFRCMRCSVLIRDEVPGEEAFRDDRYDEGTLELLHATHREAFAQKESDYRSLLPASARVIEVGSYVGGFLSTAATWGWEVVGADIGRDAVRFCRELGLDARCTHLEECGLAAESFDAVFVWNCFEQLAAPAALLAEARRVLRVGGFLVVRIPDADFYIRHTSVAVLAYNGLLGWPHRFGYDAQSVRWMVENREFLFVRALRRPAVRPLRETMVPWAREEESRVIGNSNHGWLELTFRKY
jgi:SAM-dependent methyltransferase